MFPWRRAALAAALALLAGLGMPRPALAHAILVRSDPPNPCPTHPAECASGRVLAAAPPRVRLLFSEPVHPVGPGMRVVGPGGRPVETGAVQSNGTELSVAVAAVETGTYQVSWMVISEDTHPEQGQFAFSVGRTSTGAAGEPISAATSGAAVGPAVQVAGRWLHFLGYALGFGPAAFLLLVLRACDRRGPATEARILQIAGLGVVALLLAEPLALLGATASLQPGGGLDANLAADVLASPFGLVLAQRVGAAGLLWVLLGAIRQGGTERAARRGGGVILGLALAAALVDGEAGHALSQDPAWPSLAINTLHVAAMGIWLGGLLTLLGLWRLPEFQPQRRAAVGGFGKVAATALAVLLASGGLLALQHLTRVQDLLTTAYGSTLTAKLLVIPLAGLLALGGRRLHRGAPARWWILEALTILGILLLAGILVTLPPPA